MLVAVAVVVLAASCSGDDGGRGAFVGLQNHSDADEVFFRRVEVSPGA